MMCVLLRRGSKFMQLSHFCRQACNLSLKASKDVGFETKASSVEKKGTGSNINNSFHRFPMLSDSGDNVNDYKIELVDSQTWGVSTGLADAWRGINQAESLRNNVAHEGGMYAPSNNEDPDLDEIEDMRIRGNLFYKLDRDSKEYEEYNFEFHRKKSQKNKGAQKESKKKEKPSRNSNEKSSKKRDGQKESKLKEKVTDSLEKLHTLDENYHLRSPVTEIQGFRTEKKLRTPTFNQLTAPYHEPFCLDIYISKASVRACIVHRATSNVVAVAHSISKDMKFDLGSTRNATACAAVGKVLAQRALADDIHNAVYTPRRGEKLEGKLQIVLESVIKNGVNVKVKIKQRKFKKTGFVPTKQLRNNSVTHQL